MRSTRKYAVGFSHFVHSTTLVYTAYYHILHIPPHTICIFADLCRCDSLRQCSGGRCCRRRWKHNFRRGDGAAEIGRLNDDQWNSESFKGTCRLNDEKLYEAPCVLPRWRSRESSLLFVATSALTYFRKTTNLTNLPFPSFLSSTSLHHLSKQSSPTLFLTFFRYFPTTLFCSASNPFY